MLHLNMESLLKSKKLRVTPFRIAVLNIFQEHSNSIEMKTLEEGLDEFDRVTLYRTIKIFLEKGVLHEVLIAGEPRKFATCPDTCQSHHHDHEHVHFHCTNCDETFCLETDHFPQLSHKGFKFDSVEVQASGLCESCLS